MTVTCLSCGPLRRISRRRPWGLRLGAPAGFTPTGLLVFQPLGMDGVRLTMEHPVSQPVGPKLTEARAGIFRYDGLGGWYQTATVHGMEELEPIVRSLAQ